MDRLENGFTDLPEDFLTFFRELEIPVIRGLTWIRANPCDAASKRAILEKNSLLPYALLLERDDLTRIESAARKVDAYTPIPLIPRDALVLEAKPEGDGAEHKPASALSPSLGEDSSLYFYTHFGCDLLDEAEMAQLRAELEEASARFSQELDVRREELAGYRERLVRVKSQKLTREGYEAAQKNVQETAEQITALEAEIAEHRERCVSIREQQKRDAQRSEELLLKRSDLEQQIREFATLQARYDLYRSYKKEEEDCAKEQKRLAQTLNELREAAYVLESALSAAKVKRSELEREHAALQHEVLVTYEPYCDLECLDLDFDFARVRGEYDAVKLSIETNLKLGLSALEEEIARVSANVTTYEQEVRSMLERNALSLEEVEAAHLTDSELEHVHTERLRLVAKMKELEEEVYASSQELGAHKALVAKEAETIKTLCKASSPRPRHMLIERDYNYELGLLASEVTGKKAEQALVGKTQEALSGIFAAYGTPEGSPLDRPPEGIELPAFFLRENLDCTAIAAFLKARTEELRSAELCSRDRHAELNLAVSSTDANPVYAQVKSILPDLSVLVTSPSKLVRDLPDMMKTLKSMLGMLEDDISRVDSIKSELSQLFFGYLERVHAQVNLIDNNSSIKIREKAKKTLQIGTPNWEENKSVYRLKTENYIESLCAHYLESLHQKLPIHDMIATDLTTRELYDKVVGLENITIHLVKVEAQRELMIPWNEVSTNSGGEGFLSSFIVLSSLLSYMRHDENDRFSAARKEGKVLLMDNPFGKTNAPHLLKPLMEMAKKNNLQLICLTGLGGDSIYDRFDNIYVLNLIPAGTSGLTVLKSTQAKGSPVRLLDLSNVRVSNDMALLELFTKDVDIDLG